MRDLQRCIEALPTLSMGMAEVEEEEPSPEVQLMKLKSISLGRLKVADLLNEFRLRGQHIM